MTLVPRTDRSDRTSRLRRATAVLTGAGTLGAAFVMAPAMTVSAPAAATPADARPVHPTTHRAGLATRPVRVARQSGPTTRIAPKSYASAAASARGATVGKDTDAVVEVPATGDLVAVTWPRTQQGLDTASVLVRVRTDAGWGEWHTVTVDTLTGEGGRYGTEPVWEPGARSVQIRVAAGDRALLRTAELTTVTSPARDADAALTPTAVPGAASAAYSPTVITRAQWGAKESLRPCPTEYSTTTKAVVVHHTADTNKYSAADSARMLRSIYAYDTQTLGWCDLAYNVVVDKYGQIFEGRAGGLTRPVKGAHAYAFNVDTFGVSILGNYDVAPVPAAGFTALARAIAMRLDSYYLDPLAKVRLTSGASGGTTRYRAGTSVTLNRINGHRDTSYTACPGRYLYPRLAELRSAVAARLTYRNSPVYRAYQARGGASVLGPVTEGEHTVYAGTKTTTFGSGRQIWTSGAGTYLVGPGTARVWRAYGGPKVGLLASNETSTTKGTYTRLSSGAYITWSRATGGTYLVSGGVRDHWVRTGGPTSSPYGYATGPLVSNSTQWWQSFSGGHIHVLRSTGRAIGTMGAVDRTYFAAGGPNGSLGAPRTAGYSYAGGVRQDFARGSIIVGANGRATIRR